VVERSCRRPEVVRRLAAAQPDTDRPRPRVVRGDVLRTHSHRRDGNRESKPHAEHRGGQVRSSDPGQHSRSEPQAVERREVRGEGCPGTRRARVVSVDLGRQPLAGAGLQVGQWNARGNPRVHHAARSTATVGGAVRRRYGYHLTRVSIAQGGGGCDAAPRLSSSTWPGTAPCRSGSRSASRSPPPSIGRSRP
jgi:hypothetical protein